MTDRLKGKRALVTAAGQGIGRAIAEAFVAEGAEVIATDLDLALVKEIQGAEGHVLDVCNKEAIFKFAAELGSIDILANIAGFVHSGSVLECDDDAWDFSFNLNVRSMHHTIQAFLPGMLERTKAGGLCSIVNMSSGASSIKGAPNRYVYGTTKAAVIGLTKAVAVDFIKDGVRCNAICPGTILSPSLEQRVAELGEQMGSVEKAMEMFVSRQPMGRLGETKEIAALAVHLAGDESAFTTGVAIPIDGGWTL